MTWIKRLWCVLKEGGHRYHVKFLPVGTSRIPEVTRIYICQRCGHERSFERYGW